MKKHIGISFYNSLHPPYVHRQYYLNVRAPSSEICREIRESSKHEPTSNVDYNQDMEMEMEGLDCTARKKCT
jgi:hypothetical protein